MTSHFFSLLTAELNRFLRVYEHLDVITNFSNMFLDCFFFRGLSEKRHFQWLISMCMFRELTERHLFRHSLNGVTTVQPYEVTCREALTNNTIIFSSAKPLLMPDLVTGFFWWLILHHLWFCTGLPSKYNWWWWFVGRYNLGCCKSNKYNNSLVTFIYSTLSKVLELAECDVSFQSVTTPQEKPNQCPPVHVPKGDSVGPM